MTFLYWVPSVLMLVSNTKAFDVADISCVKKVIFGGEVTPMKQLNDWMDHLPDALYVNGYGQTEGCDGVSYYTLDRRFKDTDSLPIGIPFPHMDILILDDDDKQVEPGGIGELCERGQSVSPGYYNDPEKTAEVFVQNPLTPQYPEKIYRTGDLVKIDEDGNIIFVGRKDFQIKHMGHRIELGEIETTVSAVEGVTECACAYNKEKQRIVLFYTGTVEEKELGKLLKERLLPYMVPGKRHKLEEMPHNVHGKVDRAELKKLL